MNVQKMEVWKTLDGKTFTDYQAAMAHAGILVIQAFCKEHLGNWVKLPTSDDIAAVLVQHACRLEAPISEIAQQQRMVSQDK